MIAKYNILLFIAVAILIFVAISKPQLPTFEQNLTEFGSENIKLTTPQEGQTVGKDFEIKGRARVFENVVTIRVKNKTTGVLILHDRTDADAPDMGQFGQFSYGVSLGESNPNIKPGQDLVVEVFQYSPKDGTESDKVTVNLKLEAN